MTAVVYRCVRGDATSSTPLGDAFSLDRFRIRLELSYRLAREGWTFRERDGEERACCEQCGWCACCGNPYSRTELVGPREMPLCSGCNDRVEADLRVPARPGLTERTTVPDTNEPDMLTHYSRALDEIYRQRQMAAYEAHVIGGVLAYTTLPKGARRQLEVIRMRLQQLARGENAHAHVDTELRQRVMAIAGMRPTLTRSAWEAGAL